MSRHNSNVIKFYTEGELREFYNLTSYHKDEVSNKTCGCFACLKIFKEKLITRWVDAGQTGTCPFCDLDTVLYEVNKKSKIDRNLLYQMRKHWLPEIEFSENEETKKS